MKNKILIAAFIFVGFVTLGLFAFTYLQTAGVYGHYECHVYTEQTDGQPLDILDGYQYYRLELKLDRTFIITSLVDSPQAVETVATGTFTKSKDSISLTYSSGQNPVEALIFPVEIFTYANGLLVRNQTGTFLETNFTTTIVQQFQKVD